MSNFGEHPNKEAFFNKIERIITKQEKIKLKIDEGWHSEAEMRSDLGWSA